MGKMTAIRNNPTRDGRDDDPSPAPNGLGFDSESSGGDDGDYESQGYVFAPQIL